jgi:tetratricopeptide (TPR) repeat protein
MFGQSGARIKAAEEAFEKGRLDEAFEIAGTADLIGQRRVEELLAKLAEPFLYRGQDHLLSKRFAEALADFDRAARCGCVPEKVAEWRRRATEARADAHRAETDRQAALAAARERMAAGSLPGAVDALARLEQDDPDRAAMTSELERRKQRAEQALSAATAAIDDGRAAAAVESICAARALDAKLAGLAEVEGRVLTQVTGEAAKCFADGRLDRAAQELATLRDVGRSDARRTDLEEALHLGREAARALADDRYSKASVLLARLTQIGPKGEWIAQVREHLNVLDERRRALLASPLGLLLGREVPSEISAGLPGGGARRDSRTSDKRTSEGETLPLARPAPPVVRADEVPAHGGAAEALPKRLLLRIDGVGSFLLLRGERVSIGHAGSGATADLPLVSDLAERQAEVIRAGEDYFVVSSGGVELADRRVDYALLHSGDRIRLGKRIRVKFLRPSQKSTTAVLELGDGVRTTTDCRRVILWSGPLLMGDTRECHIPLAHAGGGVILLERDGRVMLRPMGPGRAAAVVAVGGPVEVGDLRLTIRPWPDSTRPGKVVG